MSLDNLTPITGSWLIVSLIALFFSILNLQASRADVKASILVKNYRRPTRLLIATGAVHRNWIKVAVFLWWSLLGVLFGLFDPPTIIGLSGLLGLVATALANAYIGYHETNERSVMADLLAEDIAEDVLDEHNEAVAASEQTQLDQDTDRQHDADIAQATVRAADRMGRLMQQTATNTERIAKNTDREKPTPE